MSKPPIFEMKPYTEFELNPTLLDNYFVTVDLSFVVSLLRCPVRCMPVCTHTHFHSTLRSKSHLFIYHQSILLLGTATYSDPFPSGRYGRSSNSSFLLNLLLLCVRACILFLILSPFNFQHSSSAQSGFYWNECDISKARCLGLM